MLNRLFHNKKGMISPVFKYIFVLVAGAVILVFFIKFAFQTEELGTEVVRAEVLHALDASLQAMSISEDSSGVVPGVPWPDMIHIQVGIGPNCGKFTVKGQKYWVPIERAIFSPSDMKAKQLQSWTLAWDFPFKVTSLFLLINSRTKNYLIYSGNNRNFLQTISSNPPQSVQFEVMHFPLRFNVKAMANDKEARSMLKVSDTVKVNYFNSINGVAEGLKGSYIHASTPCFQDLMSDENHKCFGTVTFYNGGKQTGTSTFIGKELLFGAIAADTFETYSCQYSLALNELERMIHIYKTKAEKLRSKKAECSNEYSQMISLLNTFEANLANLRSNPTFANAGAISSTANSIKDYNERILAGDENCVELF